MYLSDIRNSLILLQRFINFPLTACPEDTYKSTNRSCMPCPTNSGTVGTTGNSLKGCVCNTGYAGPPGGPCKG